VLNYDNATNTFENGATVHKKISLTLAAKATYYINMGVNTTSIAMVLIGSDTHIGTVSAVCAYL
jgi:hypothetical protein